MLKHSLNRPIDVHERCDRCGAQARVRAILTTGELYFCGHHARATGNKLVLQAMQVYDPESVFNYGR